MSAIREEDTLSRGALSHSRRGPLTLNYWPFGARMRSPGLDSGRLRSHLLTLVLLRGSLLGGFVLALVAIGALLDVRLPMAPLIAAIAALIAALALALHRVKQPAPISHSEFLGHLGFDVVWLAHALYWLGGSEHNPFADLFVVYIGIAALVLRRRQVVLVLVLSLSAFALLRKYHYDLNWLHASLGPKQLDMLGHQVHFVLFGLIAAFFGYRLSTMNRRFDRLAALAHLRDVEHEKAVDLAALAAGTAHEMGTPLTTIAVLAHDMRRGEYSPDEFDENLDAICAAVQSCKQSLRTVVVAMGADRIGETEQQTAREFVDQLIQLFRPMRPGTTVAVHMQCPQATTITVGAPLRQALISLLANAADAAGSAVDVQLDCTPAQVQIDVLDRGPGIPAELRDRLGEQIATTKPGTSGNGVGIYLAKLTISRIGGRLEFLPREGGGTCARVTVPVAA